MVNVHKIIVLMLGVFAIGMHVCVDTAARLPNLFAFSFSRADCIFYFESFSKRLKLANTITSKIYLFCRVNI